MAMWSALSASFTLSTASDAAQGALHVPNETPPWGFHLIPTLILTGTVLLSLEIFDHTRVSRPLAATTLVALWTLALGEELQAASLLAAALYHGVHEAHGEWTRGFPSLFQQDSAARKLRLWARFWLRVFVWASTLAAATRLQPAPQETLAAFQAALFVVVYCECTELLLVLYFADKSTGASYGWRRRALLWAASLVLGTLYATQTLAAWVVSVVQRVRPVSLALVMVVVMVVSVRVEWPRVVASVHALAALVRRKMTGTTTTKVRTGQRRSFLYRAGSDVEVVGAAMHYEAYDFRHKHEQDVV